MQDILHPLALKIAAVALGTFAVLSSIVSPVQPAAVALSTQNATGGVASEIVEEAKTYASAQQGMVLGKSTSAGITEAQVDQKLDTFRQEIATLVSSLVVQLSGTGIPASVTSSQYTQQINRIFDTVTRSSRTDELSGTELTNVTINGVSGLTTSDIPDLSSSYLTIASTTSARSTIGLSYAANADITGNINIATWGDSLTSGTGGTPYPTQLKGLSGYAVYDGGVGGETSTQIKARMLAATDKYSWPTIIWAGRNNISDPTTVKADIAAMVAALTTDHYIILSILNTSAEPTGSANYNTIIQLNSDLATAYGSHFIDIRSYLVSLYNSSLSQDVTDYGNDVVPSSLRYDTVHLTTTGYSYVAQKIYQNISLLQSTTQNVVTPSQLAFLFGTPPPIGSVSSSTGTFTTGTFNSISAGTSTTAAKLHLAGTGELLRLSYDSTNYTSFQTSSAGNLTISPTGGQMLVSSSTGQALIAASGVVSGAMTAMQLNNAQTASAARGSLIAFTGTSGFVTQTQVGAAWDGSATTDAYLYFKTRGSNSLTERLRITSAGNVGIGTSTPYSRLTVWGTDTASSTLSFNVVNSASTTVFAVFNGGNAQLSGTLTQSSDSRLKEDIKPLDASSTLALIDKLDPVTFTWKGREEDGIQVGFIAQDVQKLFPELVSVTAPTAFTPGGTLGVNYIGFIAPIIKSIQALVGQVNALTSVVSGFAESFTSKKVTTDELCVKTSSGSPVCVIGDQLLEFLSDSGQSATPPADEVVEDPAPEANEVSPAQSEEDSTVLQDDTEEVPSVELEETLTEEVIDPAPTPTLDPVSAEAQE